MSNSFSFTCTSSTCLTGFSFTETGHGWYGTVEVTFASGATYRYECVNYNDAVYVMLAYLNGESVGKEFIRRIRNVYAAEKIAA